MEKDILNELYCISEVLERITGYQQEMHNDMVRFTGFGIIICIFLIISIVLIGCLICISLGLIPSLG